MKRLFSALLILFFTSQVNAQYYYLDVIGTNQTNTQHQKITDGHFSKINATSFEANNQVSEDFKLDQQILQNGRQVITRSATVNSVESFFTSFFNENNRLVKTVDSSSNAINTVEYVYDNNGRLTSTSSSSKDFDGTFNSTEQHIWKYGVNGQPTSMLKLKNGADSLMVTFKYDEAGNTAEENWKKGNRTLETYYYYYNANNKLTDIVRFNRRAKQMLPDFMFEYDNTGLVSQMTQAQGASANYLVWRYFYNPQGLKEKEVVFNKRKELLGKIEYKYE